MEQDRDHYGAMDGGAARRASTIDHNDGGEGAPSRRAFLQGAAIASAATLILPRVVFGGDRSGACGPTTADIEGPFYKTGSPFRVALAPPGEPGQPLSIGGAVYANDCATPLQGVTIDVWAANDEGCYNNNVDCSPHSDDVYNLRGRMLSGEHGEYGFTTIKPGRYLNGAQYRPSHIHFRITAPGRPALVTQLYFAGDDAIPIDPWASEPDAAARIIPLAAEGNGLHGTFDIILNVPPPQAAAPYDAGIAGMCELIGNAPNPFVEATAIEYRVASHGRVELAIYDMLGRRVRTLVSSVHGAGRYAEQWDGTDDGGARLPAGLYTCRMQAGTFTRSRTMMLAAR